MLYMHFLAIMQEIFRSHSSPKCRSNRGRYAPPVAVSPSRLLCRSDWRL